MDWSSAARGAQAAALATGAILSAIGTGAWVGPRARAEGFEEGTREAPAISAANYNLAVVSLSATIAGQAERMKLLENEVESCLSALNAETEGTQ